MKMKCPRIVEIKDGNRDSGESIKLTCWFEKGHSTPHRSSIDLTNRTKDSTEPYLLFFNYTDEDLEKLHPGSFFKEEWEEKLNNE
jgi:hypothetical protein